MEGYVEIRFYEETVDVTIEKEDGFIKNLDYVTSISIDPFLDRVIVSGLRLEHYYAHLSEIRKITIGDYVLTIEKKDV